MYAGIITNFTLKNTFLSRKLRKQALIRQIDIVKMKTDAVNMKTLIQTFVKSISTIKTLKPILTCSMISNLLLS